MHNLTLGELIKKLEAFVTLDGGDMNVEYDFGWMAPTVFCSYRGYYEQLALGYEHGFKVTVKELLEKAKSANGETFYGWKGGEYTMHDDSPLWVANSGESHGTAIIAVLDFDYKVVIKTEKILNDWG